MYGDTEKKVVRKITDTIIWRGFYWFGAVVLLSGAINLATEYFRYGFDDTDGEQRSGMGVLTDARTNCQYLYTPSGGLTPRMSRDGTQICE
jgi:hypothetical protein